MQHLSEIRVLDVADVTNIPLAYTIEGATQAAGIGRTSIFAAIKTGELQARKFGSKNLIERAELRRWISTLPTIGRP